MALKFKSQSTGAIVAKRDEEGRFLFRDYWDFNALTEAATNGECFVDSRGRTYDGDAFLDLLEKSRWLFELDEEEEDERLAGRR